MTAEAAYGNHFRDAAVYIYTQVDYTQQSLDEVVSMARFAAERDLKELLPLKPIELLVLTMLSAGERHGYGLRQDIVAHTGGEIALEAGNLYRHIRRLQSEGLVDESDPRPIADNDDERRIYYRLLPFGRRVLAAEVMRLRALMRIVEANHVISPART
jgi:DNA-binding PadR family transcriptional regulator